MANTDRDRIPVRVTCGARCGFQDELPMNPEEIHRAILYASCPRCGAAYSVERRVRRELCLCGQDHPYCMLGCSPKYGRDDHEGYHQPGCPNIGRHGTWDS